MRPVLASTGCSTPNARDRSWAAPTPLSATGHNLCAELLVGAADPSGGPEGLGGQWWWALPSCQCREQTIASLNRMTTLGTRSEPVGPQLIHLGVKLPIVCEVAAVLGDHRHHPRAIAYGVGVGVNADACARALWCRGHGW